MKCEKCGTEVPDNASFCNNCGNRLLSEEKTIDNTKPLFQSRGFTSAMQTGMMLNIGIDIVLILFTFVGGSYYKREYALELWYTNTEWKVYLIYLLGASFIISAIVTLIRLSHASDVFFTVYPDRVEGNAGNGITRNDFSLTYEKIQKVEHRGKTEPGTTGAVILTVNQKQYGCNMVTDAWDAYQYIKEKISG